MQSHNNNLKILIKKSVSILLFFNLFPWKAYFTHNVTNTQKLKQSTSSQLLDQASGPLELVQELILIHHITISNRLLLLEILLIFILWIHYLTYTTLDFCFAFLFFCFPLLYLHHSVDFMVSLTIVDSMIRINQIHLNPLHHDKH